MDRRQAFANHSVLPEKTFGAALFVDISAFTSLTQTLVQEHGRKQGAEEILNIINPIFEQLIQQLHNYRGSVIGFAGDAITCWFDSCDDIPLSSARAVACGLAMQTVMQPYRHYQTKKGTLFPISIKVAVVFGSAQRFLVGNPNIKVIDSLAGKLLSRMANAEAQAKSGEVVVGQEVVKQLNKQIVVQTWRNTFAVVDHLSAPVAIVPWDTLPTSAFCIDDFKHWVLASLTKRLQIGKIFEGDLRSVTPMMIRFGGIDFDNDKYAGQKLDNFIRWMQAIIHEHGGTLLQLTFGDKGAFIYAPFGAPVGNEDDAQRALAVALAFQTPPAKLAWLPPLQIGISHGEVWTGMCGATTRHTYSVIGRDVNLAARLMMQAEPGQTLVSERVFKQTQFHFRPVGLHMYKGFTQPIPTYELLGEEATEPQIFTSHLVGRDGDLKKLAQFTQAQFAIPRHGVAIIYGEPGMGKSHLTHALQQQMSAGVKWMTGQCDPILRRAFNPFIYFLKRYFGQKNAGISPNNKANFEQTLQQLHNNLNHHPENQQHLQAELKRTHSFLGALLDIYWEDSLYEQLDAQVRYQNTINAISVLIQAECQLQPVVLEIEDAHWLDTASQEMLTTLVRATKNLPLLLLITSRYRDDGTCPDYLPESNAPTIKLELATLDSDNIRLLAQRILGLPIDSKLETMLLEKSGSNPFFTQQILFYLQENDLLRVDQINGQPTTTLVSDSLEMPANINTLLIARLDRLPQSIKDVVQSAAVLGREFDSMLLNNMLGQDLTTTLEIGQQQQIWTVKDNDQYIFKHALLQDAAYDMQLRVRLRRLHYLAAETGEQLYAQQPKAHYATLAYHYESAYHFGLDNVKNKTTHYLQLTGQHALLNFENKDAIDFFSRALALIPPENQQYDLYLEREIAFGREGNRTDQATDLDQLLALAENPRQKVKAALRYGAYYNNVGDYVAAFAVSEQANQWAIICSDSVSQAQAMINKGQSQVAQGHYKQAEQQYQMAFELLQDTHAPLQFAHALGGLGEVAFQLGDYATAEDYHRQALTIRQDIDNHIGQVQSWRTLGQIAMARADYEEARKYYLEAVALTQEIGDRPHEGWLMLDIGDTYIRQGEFGQVNHYFQKSLELVQITGDRGALAEVLRNLGNSAGYQGLYSEAVGYDEQSRVIFQEIGDLAGESDVLNHLGSMSAAQGLYKKAQLHYNQSLLITQKIGRKSGQVTALVNLGNVALDQGQLEGALSYYSQTLPIVTELEDKFTKGIITLNLGNIFLQKGRVIKAENYYRQSSEVAQEIGDQIGVSYALNSLGNIFYMQGQFDNAQSYYEQSLAVAREIKDPAAEGRRLRNLGHVFENQGNYKKAQTYLAKGLQFAQEVGNQNDVGLALTGLGGVSLSQSQLDEAERFYEKALHIHEALDQPQHMLGDLAGLAFVAWQKGDMEVVREYAGILTPIYQNNPTFEGAINQMRGLYYTWQIYLALEWTLADDVFTVAIQTMKKYLDNQPDPQAQAIYLSQSFHKLFWNAQNSVEP